MLGLESCCTFSKAPALPFASDAPAAGGIGELGPLRVAVNRLLGAVGTFLGLLGPGRPSVSVRCRSVALSCLSAVCPTSELLDDAELELYISKGAFPFWFIAVVSRLEGLELRALLLLAASPGSSLVVSRVE